MECKYSWVREGDEEDEEKRINLSVKEDINHEMLVGQVKVKNKSIVKATNIIIIIISVMNAARKH